MKEKKKKRRKRKRKKSQMERAMVLHSISLRMLSSILFSFFSFLSFSLISLSLSVTFLSFIIFHYFLWLSKIFTVIPLLVPILPARPQSTRDQRQGPSQFTTPIQREVQSGPFQVLLLFIIIDLFFFFPLLLFLFINWVQVFITSLEEYCCFPYYRARVEYPFFNIFNIFNFNPFNLFNPFHLFSTLMCAPLTTKVINDYFIDSQRVADDLALSSAMYVNFYNNND